jgi:hypothetical protein
MARNHLYVLYHRAAQTVRVAEEKQQSEIKLLLDDMIDPLKRTSLAVSWALAGTLACKTEPLLARRP